SGSPPIVTLLHGSALVYCNSIASGGLSYEELIKAGVGAHRFCTSVSLRTAKEYALGNVLVRTAGQIPAVVEQGLPLDLLRHLLGQKLAAWVPEDKAVEFEPETFAIVNRERIGVSVRTVTETTITFDE